MEFGDKDVEEVTREAQSAKEAAIEGVPYFISAGACRVGCAVAGISRRSD